MLPKFVKFRGCAGATRLFLIVELQKCVDIAIKQAELAYAISAKVSSCLFMSQHQQLTFLLSSTLLIARLQLSSTGSACSMLPTINKNE
jgi:hypothetical protein